MLAVDRIINNTQLMVDTDLLIKKIRVALTQTGKIAITNTMGLGERAVVASEAAELEEMQSGKKPRPSCRTTRSTRSSSSRPIATAS
jgi:hypothetical protein